MKKAVLIRERLRLHDPVLVEERGRGRENSGGEESASAGKTPDRPSSGIIAACSTAETASAVLVPQRAGTDFNPARRSCSSSCSA